MRNEELETLRQQRLLTDLDVHFARLMARLAGTDSPELLLAACLVSRGTGNGNVCIHIPALGGRPLLELAADGKPLVAPQTSAWLAALRSSPVVGRPGDFRPLILDRKGRLYLYRYWDYERRLAQDLLARAAAAPDIVDGERLRDDLARLFPEKPPESPTDWQRVAAATAALKRFCVISGGPGTGKTTTVVKILALLAGQDRPPRIALAAPTGKAAGRLQEAVRQAKQHLGAIAEAIPEQATTIHRLLGARLDSVAFRYHRDNPLPLDVLVVDEASMVDLALMAKLVAALPPQARLLLLGDKDQLASVEAGAVLGDICDGFTGFSEAWREQLQELTGETIPAGQSTASSLNDAIVLLRQSYRFTGESGIARLAQAVNQGYGEQALALLLENGACPDLRWCPVDSLGALREGLSARIEQGYRPYLESLKANASPERIFAAFNRFRLLCALREGPLGVAELNRFSAAVLQARHLINPRQSWYPGRPVMITRNDYPLRLFNGDIGITLADPAADGRLRVFFQGADGGLRRLPPTRLPEHETVYATTVHKSQGSEFDQVALVLPLEASPVLSRELVYTGITRARQRVEIWSNGQVFRAALAHGTRRSSGLREALWGD